MLLINLGTPDNPSTGAVRRYLSEFLNDPRVIDLPWLARKMLVNLIIVPFRAPKSAKIYQELWDMSGGKSPLLIHGEAVRDAMRSRLEGQDVTIELAMRYGNPSLDSVLEKMRKANYDQLILLPLYPQYASASTGSTLEKAMKIISKWWVIPEVKLVGQFWDHPGYIDTVVAQAQKHDLSAYDHVLFSYHGLPERQVDKVYDDGHCKDHNCETEITDDNRLCYKATCYGTTRLIAEKLGLKQEDYTVCFQSRLDKEWLEPFSDVVVQEKAKAGAKKLLIFSPAFVADCLETLVEIGGEYQELFEEAGGEKVQLVESLNAHPLWIDALEDMITSRI